MTPCIIGQAGDCAIWPCPNIAEVAPACSTCNPLTHAAGNVGWDDVLDAWDLRECAKKDDCPAGWYVHTHLWFKYMSQGTIVGHFLMQVAYKLHCDFGVTSFHKSHLFTIQP